MGSIHCLHMVSTLQTLQRSVSQQVSQSVSCHFLVQGCTSQRDNYVNTRDLLISSLALKLNKIQLVKVLFLQDNGE